MKKTLLILLCIFSSFYGHTQAPTNGLVAYWPMDGNFNDLGTNAINGTNFGATNTNNIFGETDKAMAFSNPNPTITVVNQYASHPNNANLNFTLDQDFSVDFNFFIASPFVHGGGLYDYGTNYFGIGVWYWNTNGFLQLQFNFGNGSLGTTDGALVYDTWQHITAIKTGTLLKIYINGVLNVSGNAGTSAPNYSSVVGRFGAMYYESFSPPQYNGHNGKLDELRIYNRALTDAEILTLYQINTLDNPNLDFQSERLLFYPNPSKEIIYFNETIKSAEIYDLTGKLIKTWLNDDKMNISSLPKGLYLLKVVDLNQKIIFDKFLKE